MHTYKVTIYSSISGHMYDITYIKTTSSKRAKAIVENRVEAHLDLYGNDTCAEGFYPDNYTIEARLNTEA
jgi:hypothetical protein